MQKAGQSVSAPYSEEKDYRSTLVCKQLRKAEDCSTAVVRAYWRRTSLEIQRKTTGSCWNSISVCNTAGKLLTRWNNMVKLVKSFYLIIRPVLTRTVSQYICSRMVQFLSTRMGGRNAGEAGQAVQGSSQWNKHSEGHKKLPVAENLS